MSRMFNSSENAAVSAIVARSFSSNDVVHDKLFIPAIVSMGVLVIICVICCYRLVVNRETVHVGEAMYRGGYNNEPPVFHSQRAIGRQGNGNGVRPLSRGLSKASRKSPPLMSLSVPGSPSVNSDTVGFHHHLQQQRQQQHRQEFEQQQDPYRQYMMAHDHPYSQQYKPPSVAMAGQRSEGGQPPDPIGATRAPSVIAQTAQAQVAQLPAILRPGTPQTLINVNPVRKASQEQYWTQPNHQNSQQLQQQLEKQPRISHTSSAQTSSTRVTSDVLSYMTPPKARRPLAPGNPSQPQNQNYFAATSSTIIPSSQTGGSPHTPGVITHSVPVNYRGSSSPHAHVSSSQPPEYGEARYYMPVPHSEKT